MSSPGAVTALTALGVLVIGSLTFVAGYAIGTTTRSGGGPSLSHLPSAPGFPAIPAIHGPAVAVPTLPTLQAPTITAPAVPSPQLPSVAVAPVPTADAAAMPSGAPAGDASAPSPAAAPVAAGDGAAAAAPPPPAPTPVTVLPALRLASLREALDSDGAAAEGAAETDGPAEPPPNEAASAARGLIAARVDPAAAAGDGPAYALELAIFRELDSARRMRADLLARGRKADVVMEEDGAGRPWYVVTHGRFAAREQAEQAGYRLWRQEGLRGNVVLIVPAGDDEGG